MDTSLNDNVYVKGLPASFTKEELEELFGSLGTVQSCRLMPPANGRGDASALVRMGSEEEARIVIEDLNGQDVLVNAGAAGSVMTVRYHGKGDPPPSDNLYVKGLPIGVADADVSACFSDSDRSVVSVRVMPPNGNAQDSTALVRMGSLEEAASALEQLDGCAFPGTATTKLVVRLANAGGKGKGKDEPIPDYGGDLNTPALRPVHTPRVVAAPVKQLTPVRAAVSSTRGYGPHIVAPLARPAFSHAHAHAQAAPYSSPSAPGLLEVRYHGSRNAPPSDNLYVKGLPANISQEEIQSVFTTYGSVLNVKVMPGQVDATALVRLSSVEEATFALQNMNGQSFDAFRGRPSLVAPGHALQVSFHGKGSNAPPSDNLYVKGLRPGIMSEDVSAEFAGFGNVVSVRVMQPNGNAADATALVRMASIEEAMMAKNHLCGEISGVEPVFAVQQHWIPTPPPAPRSFPAPWVQAPGRQNTPPARQEWAAPSAPSIGGIELRFHGPKGAPPSDNIYVKGLRAGSSDAEVRAMFAPYGNVVRLKVMPGVADATALVQMASVEEAEYTVNEFASQVQIGQMAEAPAIQGIEVRFHGPKGAPPSDNLYVKGLPAGISEDEVRDVFAACGNVLRLKIMPPRQGAFDATALVRMASVDEAECAVNTFASGSGDGHRSSPY